VLTRFGLLRGVAHVEYIQGRDDGKMYFLEAGARVGGAHVADVVEAATGLNLWAEWCDIELDKGAVPYVLPATRHEHAGLIQSLARTEHPDLSAFNDPEVVAQTNDPVSRGPRRAPRRYHARVRALLDAYARRFADEIVAVAPHYALPPLR
jgi:hypothetical protein